jgi:hypothetical protein
VSDESCRHPEDEGGQDDAGAVVGSALVVPGRDRTVLLEPADTALDHIALPIAHQVNSWWPSTTPAPARPSGLLVRPFRDGGRDPTTAQHRPAARIRIAAVGYLVVRALAWTATPARSCDGDGVQQGLKLGALMALARGDQQRQWSAVAVPGEMDLGREPTPASPQRFTTGRFDRLV